jgi:hypothetical protein
MAKLWRCPHCAQTSTRRWNLKIHIRRQHGAIGLPIEGSSAAIHNQFVPEYSIDYDKTYDNQGYPNKPIFAAIQGIKPPSKVGGQPHDILYSIRKNRQLLSEIVEFNKLWTELSLPNQTPYSMSAQTHSNMSNFNSAARQNVQ